MKVICDIEEDRAQRAAKMIEEAGQPRPTLYMKGDLDFQRMCQEEDLDLVYTASAFLESLSSKEKNWYRTHQDWFACENIS